MSKARAELCRRIGYTFADSTLFERALTHRSHGANNYERLEFLGDSVLNFTVSAELYDRFPDLSEGELTRLRASLVKKEALAEQARALRLGDCLALGGGELKSGGFDRDSILADALEALIGAVYRDSGIDAARDLVLRLYRTQLAQLAGGAVPKDFKTRLQEHLQQQGLPVPVYNVLDMSGEPHNQIFVVECRVTGLVSATRGEGSNRRVAEQRAAEAALSQLGVK
ncbi:MAG: ribonuclease III [Gammaproteobacteria bacterium]